jgi:hypothetical protein
MTEVLRMPVTLAVRALRNVSFGIRGFKFNFALLEEFYLEDFFLLGTGLRSTKNMERRSLVIRCLILKTFVTE